MRRSPVIALLALVASGAGCTGSAYHDEADRAVDSILREFDRKALADRANSVVMPKPAAPDPDPAAAPDATPSDDPATASPTDSAAVPASVPSGDPIAPTSAAAEPPREPLVLDLKKTLQIAVTSSREYVTRKESLYLSGLGFSLTRFNYGPQYSSAVNYVWGDGDGTADTSSVGGSFGVSQLLPTNGTLGLSTGIGKTMNRDDGGGGDDWSTSTGISLTQPLLRGAGYDQYRETLTQAERGMVYSVRDFELFRQDYVIQITEQFFNLVAQKRQLANSADDLDSALFDERRTEALKQVERQLEEDVVRARRRRLDTEQQVNDARVDLQRALERFLIQLGLDPRTPVELIEEEPPFERVSFDPASAVEVALHNRLDVKTERDGVDDAERQFRLARDNLLPDLNLNASYGSSGAGRTTRGAFPDTWSRSASVSLEIPLQTIDRRNAWRQAEISIEQTRRSWSAFLDDLRSDVEDQLRALANTDRQLELDEQSLAQEARSVRRQELLLERGDASNRDLLEARQALVKSKNAIIGRKVDQLIQRLRVYRSLGILFIGEDGSWSVGVPAPTGTTGEGR